MEQRTGSNKINFTGIARELGLSKMTVYRVVNNQASVSPQTRDRVIAALHNHGYFTHAPTQNLKILFDFTDQAYLAHYGHRLMAKIRELKYFCQESNHRKEPERFRNLASECDAAVFFSIPDSKLIDELRKLNPDLYTITISTRSNADVTISPNNTLGGELAARHFYANGHRHIAVHLAESHPTRMERYNAFYAEMKLLAPDCQIDRIDEKLGQATAEVLQNYFDHADPMPTAIFFLAGGFAEIYRDELLLKEPERYNDLSVMTFDRPGDLEYATLHYDFDHIEFVSPNLLDWAEYYITNRPMMQKRSPIHTSINVQLVVTGSVRKIAGATGRGPAPI